MAHQQTKQQDLLAEIQFLMQLVLVQQQEE
jgi:hypothetical protein